MKSKRLFERQLFGCHGVDRERHVPTEAQLSDHGLRAEGWDRGTQGRGRAAAFEVDVEMAFLMHVACEAVTVLCHVQCPVGADVLRLLQGKLGHIRGDDFNSASHARP